MTAVVTLLPPLRLRVGLLLGIWVLISLLSAGPTYLHYLAQGQAVPWSRLFSEVTGWYLWAPLFPLIVWAGRRFPLGGDRRRLSLSMHLLIGSVVAVLYGVLVLLKNQLIFLVLTGEADPHLMSLVPGYLLGGFQFYLVIYGLLVTGVHAVDYYRKYREREFTALELEARLSKAHLQMLKMQLEPHFLFNTLNAISALIHAEPDKAERMVGLLGDFLRSSLRGSSQQEVALEEEVEILGHYLEIQEARFGRRLVVNVDIASEVRSAAVPALILQPLVENSIRHGLDAGRGDLTVRIVARRIHGDRLELSVSDDGPGFPEPVETAITKGIGLSNTQARLDRLYGANSGLDLRNAYSGGAVVATVFPLRLMTVVTPTVRVGVA